MNEIHRLFILALRSRFGLTDDQPGCDKCRKFLAYIAELEFIHAGQAEIIRNQRALMDLMTRTTSLPA